MKGHCDKCGSDEDYNFSINNGRCNSCISSDLDTMSDALKEIANLDHSVFKANPRVYPEGRRWDAEALAMKKIAKDVIELVGDET